MITLFKKRVLQFLNKTSLWMQLAIFMTLICTVIAISLIYKDYTSTRKNIIHNFVETNTKLLNLEVNNLEDYLSNLANYCILPCYDSEFTRLINQPKSFSSTNISYLKQQMYYYYYTRNDIIDYHITFLNQKLSIGRSQNEQRMGTKHVSIDSMELLSNACFNSKFNHVILPSEKEDSFFTFYQALIKIKTQNPQAIVEVRVDKTALHTLLKNHSIDGETLLFFNEENSLVYSTSDTLSNLTLEEIRENSKNRFTYETISTQNTEYLVTQSIGENYGITLISLTPISYINDQINSIRKSIIVVGILLWLGIILLINFLLRLLIKPLKELILKMDQAGSGDFKTTINKGGSCEIIDLTNSFNSMVFHIDELIQRTYMAELSEKNAKLTALEAQLNPHFLYNTLQAISTEAIMNEQHKLNKMITSLARNLRYTIKDNDLVTIENEMNYVKDYIYLQKIRMDDNLSIEMKIDPNTYHDLIPKISIQTLVENSIIHGLSTTKSTIKISISITLESNKIKIVVRDNGSGIPLDTLEKLSNNFRQPLIPGSDIGIGLVNLNARLQLLYKEPATLSIQSEINSYTEITLLIPITIS